MANAKALYFIYVYQKAFTQKQRFRFQYAAGRLTLEK